MNFIGKFLIFEYLKKKICVRFQKRIYIRPPDTRARKDMFKFGLRSAPNSLLDTDLNELAIKSER